MNKLTRCDALKEMDLGQMRCRRVVGCISNHWMNYCVHSVSISVQYIVYRIKSVNVENDSFNV